MLTIISLDDVHFNASISRSEYIYIHINENNSYATLSLQVCFYLLSPHVCTSWCWTVFYTVVLLCLESSWCREILFLFCDVTIVSPPGNGFNHNFIVMCCAYFHNIVIILTSKIWLHNFAQNAFFAVRMCGYVFKQLKQKAVNTISLILLNIQRILLFVVILCLPISSVLI
jgi:hypothetical protein